MKYSMKTFFYIALLGFILTSCGTARTIVYDPVVLPNSMTAITQVEIFNRPDTVSVPCDVKELFEKTLRKRLFSKDLVECAPGIKLEYRFIQYNEGNRFARYMFGGIGNEGEASLLIEVTYIGLDGSELGKVQTEGRISSGLFGGSSDSAVEKAAAEVANFTRNMLIGN